MNSTSLKYAAYEYFSITGFHSIIGRRCFVIIQRKTSKINIPIGTLVVVPRYSYSDCTFALACVKSFITPKHNKLITNYDANRFLFISFG